MRCRPDIVLALLIVAAPAMAGEADRVYAAHCAACHGVERLGGAGPALLPGNLKRLRKPAAAKVIKDGRAATQMPAFGAELTDNEVDALVELIYTPPAVVPVWDVAEIAATRTVEAGESPAAPVHDADPLNLFVVVESGDHHVTILDGDRFEPITRFQSRFALHGGPKFSPDGRFVYFASRDGWITKYDLYGLRVVAEVRAGINTRNLAISGDGRVIAVANYLPHSLVFLDATDLALLEVIPVEDFRGKESSRVSAVYQAAPRESFVVALKDVPEIWEVSYAEDPPASYSGFVHNYEKGMEEAIADDQGRFPIRRILLDEPLDDFFFSPNYRTLVGSSRDGGRGVVVHLDVRRKIAELPLPGFPHLGSGISWPYNGGRVMATPNLKEGRVSVIDMKDWSVIKTIETLGPGFFMRSHENAPHAWTDVFFGPNKEALHVIDKQSLEIVKTLRPAPGKTAAHVEFTRDGRYALVSVWDMDGAIVVYDAVTLEEKKRIPMVKPSGKYNVFNKITRSEGTSH
jgi:DNA-binding beta-propeller fold protein YncE